MPTFYVSNAAVNGAYIVGNDANAGTAEGTAKLTIDGAVTAASNGDTIYVNPGGVTYSENTAPGLNYLNVTKQLTIRGDPNYVATAGKPTVTSPGAGTRTINLNQGSIALIDLIIDNASGTRNCVFCQSFSGHTLTRCDFHNLGANAIAVTAQNNNAYNITIDKCTLLAANGNAAGSKLHQITGTLGGMATAIKGCTTTTTGGLFAAGAGFGGTVTISASADGTRNSITSATLGIQNLSTNVTTTFAISGTDFTTCTTGIGDGGTTSAVMASLSVLNCSFNGLNGSSTAKDIAFVSTIADGEIAYNQFLGGHQNISLSSGAVAGLEIHDNVAVTSSMATTVSNFLVTRGGTGIKIYNNKITSDSDSRLIAVGGDGYASAITNSGGALSGDQDFGAAAANTYVAQTYTYPAAGTALFETYLGAFDIYLKKVGSPTGTVTCYLYSNNSGAPGSILATSDYTLDASLLTTSYQQVRFYFLTEHYAQVYSTQYWIVVKYTGTIDGANYLRIQKYTAGTAGQLSSVGSGWSAAAAALGYNARQKNHTFVSPEVYSNTLICTNATEITHCLAINATNGGLAYNNVITGGAIGVLFKLVDGVTNPAMAYNNMISFSNTGDGAALHDKGSKGVLWYYNTAVITDGDNRALFIEGDWNSGYLNGNPSTNTVVKNNIISGAATTNYLVALGNSNASDYTIVNPTLDYNIYYNSGAATFAAANLGRAATYTTYDDLAELKGATGEDGFSLEIDPALVDTTPNAPSDFLPSVHSPASGRGTNLTSPTTDYYGTTRPTPSTIGALEGSSRTGTNGRSLTTTRSVVR